MSKNLFRLIVRYSIVNDERSHNLRANVVSGIFLKIGNVLCSLILVRILIQHLVTEEYGVWITISSLASFAAFFDIGLGNGLRNSLSESLTRQQKDLSIKYISTSYFLFGAFQLFFVAIFIVLVYTLDWQNILNTNIALETLRTILLIICTGFCLKLVLDVINYVLFAFQRASEVNFIQLLANVTVSIAVYFITETSSPELNIIATITTVIPLLVSFFYTIYLFRGKFKEYIPSLQDIEISYGRQLMSLGSQFFIIQLAVLVIFYTDSLIITNLFGPKFVTEYSISYRYFNLVNTVFYIIVSPLWSAITEAKVKDDFEWIKTTYRRLQFVWVGVASIVVMMIIVAQPVYSIWIGRSINIPVRLNVTMGVFVLLTCWNNATVAVTNGLNKVRIQLITSTIGAIVNIPLSIYFGKYLNLGSSGVILATCCSIFFGTVCGTIQADLLVNRLARGIWNR